MHVQLCGSSLPRSSSPNDVIPVYINTNEIPGELSHENLTSSHVKITCYLQLLWLHNKLHFSHQNTNKVKLFGISLVFIL